MPPSTAKPQQQNYAKWPPAKFVAQSSEPYRIVSEIVWIRNTSWDRHRAREDIRKVNYHSGISQTYTVAFYLRLSLLADSLMISFSLTHTHKNPFYCPLFEIELCLCLFFSNSVSLFAFETSCTKKSNKLNLAAGINGGYYSGGLHTQQAHSTTPLEAPGSLGSAASAPPSQSASAPPSSAPPGIHGLVSKSVSTMLCILSPSTPYL